MQEVLRRRLDKPIMSRGPPLADNTEEEDTEGEDEPPSGNKLFHCYVPFI